MNNAIIIGALAAFILLAALAIILLGARAGSEHTADYPFQRNDYLLSRAERSLYEVLHRTVYPGYRVFPKVRLAEIVHVKRGTERWGSHFNRIKSKHVDFLVCSTDTLTPILVIELDDSSHATPDGKGADAFRNNVFKAAGLPLLRISARATYNPREVTAQVEAALAPPRSPQSAAGNGRFTLLMI